MDYKKLLDKQFKLAIELDNYWNDWKWMRVNSDNPNVAAYSGRLTTAPQRPGPALQYLKKRYTPLRVIEFIES